MRITEHDGRRGATWSRFPFIQAKEHRPLLCPSNAPRDRLVLPTHRLVNYVHEHRTLDPEARFVWSLRRGVFIIDEK